MRQIFFPTLTILFSLMLASCSGKASPASTTSVDSGSYVSPNLDAGFENALNARMQLTLGSLKLAETNTPITSAQASIMLPLWEGLLNMTSAGNSAQAEVNALLSQIEGALTPEQLAAIREMKLTSIDLQTWAAANGIILGSGTGQPGVGQGSGMSPKARATKQAAEGITNGSGSSGVSTAMLNTLIVYLESLLR